MTLSDPILNLTDPRGLLPRIFFRGYYPGDMSPGGYTGNSLLLNTLSGNRKRIFWTESLTNIVLVIVAPSTKCLRLPSYFALYKNTTMRFTGSFD